MLGGWDLPNAPGQGKQCAQQQNEEIRADDDEPVGEVRARETFEKVEEIAPDASAFIGAEREGAHDVDQKRQNQQPERYSSAREPQFSLVPRRTANAVEEGCD